MNPRIHVITLAVADLDRALAFYRDGLGLRTEGSDLAKDADIPLIAAKPGEFSIGHLVDSRAEVDEIIAQAEAAGATVTVAACGPLRSNYAAAAFSSRHWPAETKSMSSPRTRTAESSSMA
jgi:hypothetical protein